MTESLTFRIVGDNTSGVKAVDGLGKKTSTVTAAMSSSFKKAGAVIGGEVGELANKVGEGLDALGEKGLGLGKKMTAAGVGIAGAGVALTMMGSKEKQAQDQLRQSIDDTGASYSDYRDEIEQTVKHEENFAHSAKDTDGALTALTQATQDPKKALEEMGVVADLAASKHESLTEAAGQMAKILSGAGSRTLKQYGITTTNVNDAVTQLSQRLHGQASAAVNNWGGRWDVLKTKVGDFVGEMGTKYGPGITATGSLLTAAGAATEMWSRHAAKAAADVGAAEEESATSARAAAAAHTESSAQTAAAAQASSETVVASEAAAMDAEESGATSSEVAAGEHVNASAVIAAASAGEAESVVASSEVEIGAYEASAAAAEESAVASSAAFGPVGLAVAGVAVVGGLAAKAMGLFGGATKQSIQPTQDFTNAIIADNNALGENTRKLAVNKLEKSGAFDWAQKLGISEKTLTDAVMGNGAAMGEVTQKIKAAGDAHGVLAFASIALKSKVGDVTKTLEVNKTAAEHVTAANAGLTDSTTATAAAQDALAASTGGVVKAQATSAQEMAQAADAAGNQVTQVDALSAALDKLSNKNIDAEQEQLRFADSLGKVRDDLKGNGHAVDDLTAKGRANREWLLTQVQALNSVANAQSQAGVSTAVVTANMSKNEAALRVAAASAHLNASEVNALITKYHAVPKVVSTEVYAATETAVQKLQDLYYLEQKLGQVTINAKVAELNDIHHNAQGTGYFSGGLTTLDEIGGHEVVELPQGSKVLNGVAAESKYGGRGGGNTYVLQLPPVPTGTDQLKRIVVGWLEDYAGAGGQIRIAQAVR